MVQGSMLRLLLAVLSCAGLSSSAPQLFDVMRPSGELKPLELRGSGLRNSELRASGLAFAPAMAAGLSAQRNTGFHSSGPLSAAAPRPMPNPRKFPRMCAASGQEDGLISLDVGKTEMVGDTSLMASNSFRLAKTAASWWKHHDKHRSRLPQDHLNIHYDQEIGVGTYGEVFMGTIVKGENTGMKVVVKRAKDGVPDPEDPRWEATHKEKSVDEEQEEQFAAGYLTVEAYINDLIKEECPEIAAPYIGMCTKSGKRWLVFEFLEGKTLEEYLIAADEVFSLQPLATALGMRNFIDGDIPSLQRLVNEIGGQLLKCCLALEKAGVAHRDIKPYNIFIANEKLVLIDFGSSAAMGVSERIGYDYNKSPCDPRYAPPEQFIDEEQWAKYDSYCVGLILVRVLFAPLWCGRFFDEFSEAFHQARYDLDSWLTKIIVSDAGVEKKPGPQIGFKNLFGAQEETRDQEYVDLADQSCSFPDDGSRLNMCSIKEGLEVLNQKGGGVCWETLRKMLKRDPVRRISSVKA
eukprot:CAMPEP_0184295916 /NCGR_PEP_ID=MMETSP1049-20130417/6826_1 /TAXON_ID=77928 /ORGANISM="Proteomonas sulcata, Strain CCMP704" /LENGTH=519 /DNA_ID=CAMNT_0026604775 /DNA_START=130 /DNA_END=1689 /DNA_ORIENTATION=+